MPTLTSCGECAYSSTVKQLLSLASFILLVSVCGPLAGQTASQATGGPPPPVEITAQQDHQRLMDLLHINSLRPGADPNHPGVENAVNYDESKANQIGRASCREKQ